MSSRTVDHALLEWLRSRTEHELTRILANRHDVLEPPWPRRLDDLTRRLSGYESALAALSQVPLPGVQVLGALQVAEAQSPGPGTEIDTLVRLLEDADERPVHEIITDMLEARALAWFGATGDIVLNERFRDADLAHLGLGRPVTTLLPSLKMPDLNRIAVAVGAYGGGARKQDFIDRLTRWFADPDNVAALLRDAPDDTSEILDDVAWNGPEFSYPVDLLYRDRHRGGFDQPGLTWAMDRGLLIAVPEGFGVAEMPLEVGLAVRGGDFALAFTPTPPVLTSAPVDPELVAAESASAALRMLDRVTSIVDGSSTDPIPLLKNGAVGVRAINSLTKSLGATADETRLAVDLANALGLLTPKEDESEDIAPPRPGRRRSRSPKHQEPLKIIGLVPSDGYPAWRGTSPASRLCSLITTWLHLPDSPLADRKRLAEVLGDEPSAAFAHVRRIVLERASELTGGFTDPGQLSATVRWHAPRLTDELVDPLADAAVREATLLGALASGAVTTLGTPLLGEEGPSSGASPELAKAAEALVAAARTTALFGTDLTAVVTGSADTELAGLLDRAADRESQSSAMTWRLTPASVRRAFDHGATVESLVGDLSSVSSTGELPQPLTYLINDVSRRHGEASVFSAASVVVAASEPLAGELAVHRKLAKLALHQVAPTVLVTTSDSATTLSALREARYSPVEKSPDGTPVLAVGSTSSPSAVNGLQAIDSTVIEHTGPPPEIMSDGAHPLLADPAHHAARLLNEPDAPVRDDDSRHERVGAHLRSRSSGRTSPEWMQLTMTLDYRRTGQIDYREDDGTTTPMRISAVDWYGDTVEVWCWDSHNYRDLDISRIQPPSA